MALMFCLVPGVCGGDPPMKTDSHQVKIADYVQQQYIHEGELFLPAFQIC